MFVISAVLTTVGTQMVCGYVVGRNVCKPAASRYPFDETFLVSRDTADATSLSTKALGQTNLERGGR